MRNNIDASSTKSKSLFPITHGSTSSPSSYPMKSSITRDEMDSADTLYEMKKSYNVDKSPDTTLMMKKKKSFRKYNLQYIYTKLFMNSFCTYIIYIFNKYICQSSQAMK